MRPSLRGQGVVGLHRRPDGRGRDPRFRYPAASPYNGTDLIYCAGNIFQDGNNTWGLKCNQTGGTSGGPWIDAIDETTGNGGTLSSVNSYLYSGGDSIYGPKFNSSTHATYNAANAATSNTVVQ